MTSRRCIACGRILSDPTSVARGYGPECYAKIRAATRTTHEDGSTITVVDAKLAGRSFKAMQTVVARVLGGIRNRGAPIVCRGCGDTSTAGYLQVRDHRGTGGYRLPGYGGDLWITLRCPECGYELSVNKIGVTQAKIDDELDRQRGYKKRSLGDLVAARTEGSR